MNTSQFRTEYLEQPDSLRRTLDNFLHKDASLNKQALSEIEKQQFTNIVFAGMGSSYYATFLIANYLNSNGIQSSVFEASELAYYGLDMIRPGTLIVIVSKSGEGPEVVTALKRLQNESFILGITDNKESTLVASSTLNLFTYAGEETAPTTKSYICTLGLLMILAYRLCGVTDEKKLTNLLSIPDLSQSTLVQSEQEIEMLAKELGFVDYVNILGRGPSITTARQGALIFKEVAGVAAEGLSSFDFEHGHYLAVGKNHLVIVISTQGRTTHLDNDLIIKVKTRGGKVLLVSDYDPGEEIVDYICRIPEVEEHLSPMLQIIPIEVLIRVIANRL